MLAFYLIALAAMAQTPDTGAFEQSLREREAVTAYLVHAARSLTDAANAEIRTREDWERVREQRRLELRDSLGLLPWPRRTPLNLRITGIVDQQAYRIEKIALQSLPAFYVTANLYVPKSEGSHPAVIYVCGHAGTAAGSKVAYQRHGISLAKNGYVAMVIDAIQHAEVYGLHRGVYLFSRYDWYARGYTPAGVEVWNAIRALDYLETRPEVDKSRIGMTGRSGGAAMSWFTAAIDPRIKVVIPVMGISTYAANVRLNTQSGHCDCMFPINFCRHDMIHQGALIAPRPLLMAHGIEDRLFPVPGYKEFEEKVGALYRAYGRADEFKNIEVEGGHSDSDFLREQAIRWFDRFLLNKLDRQLDLAYENLPDEALSVFGGNPPADASNHLVHDTFTSASPRAVPATLTEWEQRRAELLRLLREKVFRAFPMRPEPLHVRRAGGAITFTSEPGITIRARLYKPEQTSAPLPALLYVASEGETQQDIDRLLRGVRASGQAAFFVVHPRGVSAVPWDEHFRKDTMRNAMHVGHTLDSMRLYDVLRGFEVLSGEPGIDPTRIMVMGRGTSAGLALYAAILEPRVHQVMLASPPDSHAEGPVFLNVLRYTDLPEAAALVAPRRINFFGGIPPAYEQTRRIFALYGKAAHFFLSMSIEHPLLGRYGHGFTSKL
jgi:cephalosporin-C deacetylase-like acetyl esterase